MDTVGCTCDYGTWVGANFANTHRNDCPADVVTHLPMRARPAPVNSCDLHPRWSNGSPVRLGQDVMHAKERWQGFVTGIPNADEVCVAWWSPEHDDYLDGEEHAPEDLLLTTADDA